MPVIPPSLKLKVLLPATDYFSNPPVFDVSPSISISGPTKPTEEAKRNNNKDDHGKPSVSITDALFIRDGKAGLLHAETLSAQTVKPGEAGVVEAGSTDKTAAEPRYLSKSPTTLPKACFVRLVNTYIPINPYTTEEVGSTEDDDDTDVNGVKNRSSQQQRNRRKKKKKKKEGTTQISNSKEPISQSGGAETNTQQCVSEDEGPVEQQGGDDTIESDCVGSEKSAEHKISGMEVGYQAHEVDAAMEGGDATHPVKRKSSSNDQTQIATHHHREDSKARVEDCKARVSAQRSASTTKENAVLADVSQSTGENGKVRRRRGLKKRAIRGDIFYVIEQVDTDLQHTLPNGEVIPEYKWLLRKWLFKKFDEGVIMDALAFDEVTPEEIAAHIAGKLWRFAKEARPAPPPPPASPSRASSNSVSRASLSVEASQCLQKFPEVMKTEASNLKGHTAAKATDVSDSLSGLAGLEIKRTDLDSQLSRSPSPSLSSHHLHEAAPPIPLRIVEACCGVGGNTIQLARWFDRIDAVDIDPSRLAMAMTNAEVYRVKANCRGVISWHCRGWEEWCQDYRSSFLSSSQSTATPAPATAASTVAATGSHAACKPLTNQTGGLAGDSPQAADGKASSMDTSATTDSHVNGEPNCSDNMDGNLYKWAFLSPPWGGSGYKRVPIFKMLDCQGGVDTIALLKSARSVARNVAVFLPRNQCLDEIVAVASDLGFGMVEVESIAVGLSQLCKVLVVYLLEDDVARGVEGADLEMSDLMLKYLRENIDSQRPSFLFLMERIGVGSLMRCLEDAIATWHSGGLTQIEKPDANRTLGGVFFQAVKVKHPEVYRQLNKFRKSMTATAISDSRRKGHGKNAGGGTRGMHTKPVNTTATNTNKAAASKIATPISPATPAVNAVPLVDPPNAVPTVDPPSSVPTSSYNILKKLLPCKEFCGE